MPDCLGTCVLRLPGISFWHPKKVLLCLSARVTNYWSCNLTITRLQHKVADACSPSASLVVPQSLGRPLQQPHHGELHSHLQDMAGEGERISSSTLQCNGWECLLCMASSLNFKHASGTGDACNSRFHCISQP